MSILFRRRWSGSRGVRTLRTSPYFEASTWGCLRKTHRCCCRSAGVIAGRRAHSAVVSGPGLYGIMVALARYPVCRCHANGKTRLGTPGCLPGAEKAPESSRKARKTKKKKGNKSPLGQNARPKQFETDWGRCICDSHAAREA